MKLQTKFFLSTIPLVATAALLMSWLAQKTITAHLIKQVLGAGITWTQAYIKSEKLIRYFDKNKEIILLPHLQAIIKNTGAAYAWAVDGQGRILAHSDVAQQGKLSGDDLTRLVLRHKTPQHKIIAGEKKNILDLAIPLEMEQTDKATDAFLLLGEDSAKRYIVGALRLGLPLDQILSTTEDITRNLFLMINIISALCALTGLIFLRKTLLRLQKMARTAEEIGQGKLGKTIPISSHDEIGELAESLNKMSRNLAQTTVSKEQLALFRQLIDESNDAIFLVDAESGRIVEANRKACVNLSYTQQELTRLRVVDIQTLMAQEGAWSRHLKILREQGGRMFEGTHKRKDQTLFPVEVNAKLVSYKNKDYIVAIVRDIANRKRLEEQLIRSEKMSAIGQLAASIAHELNNPLAGILTIAQIVLSEIPKEAKELKKDLETIEDSAQRCKKIVSDLLAFTRSHVFHLGPVSLRQCVEKAIALTQHEAELNHIEMVNQIPRHAPYVQASAMELEQVIINLLLNSIQAMPDGGALTIWQEPLDHEKINIKVKDTGLGIHPDKVQTIFDPFYTTKPQGKGTGLGLYICSRLVEQFGGTIWAESRGLGKGATFSIILLKSRPNDLGGSSGAAETARLQEEE